MLFKIEPLKGAKEVTFGMLINDVRTALPSSFKSFKRTPSAVHPCDFFEALGIFIYYDSTSHVEAIEFTQPAIVMLENNNLTNMSFENLTRLLSELDPQLEIEGDSFTSYSLGIGGYAPDAEEMPDNSIESIIIFRLGYYD